MSEIKSSTIIAERIVCIGRVIFNIRIQRLPIPLYRQNAEEKEYEESSSVTAVQMSGVTDNIWIPPQEVEFWSSGQHCLDELIRALMDVKGDIEWKTKEAKRDPSKDSPT